MCNCVSTVSRINGIEASTADVKAINPKDIIRVEYHDQPGVRYNGAAAVVDYIVKHRDTGGSLMLAGTNGLTLPGIGNYYLAGKVHFNKSSLQAIASYAPYDIYWTRTNNETYHFSTGKIENNEVGEPTRYKTYPVNVSLNYWHIHLTEHPTATAVCTSRRIHLRYTITTKAAVSRPHWTSIISTTYLTSSTCILMWSVHTSTRTATADFCKLRFGAQLRQIRPM